MVADQSNMSSVLIGPALQHGTGSRAESFSSYKGEEDVAVRGPGSLETCMDGGGPTRNGTRAALEDDC